MTLLIAFDNSYARLPGRFFVRQAPVPVASPALIAVNEPLARNLGIDPGALALPAGVAMLAGNALPPGAVAPVAAQVAKGVLPVDHGHRRGYGVDRFLHAARGADDLHALEEETDR